MTSINLQEFQSKHAEDRAAKFLTRLSQVKLNEKGAPVNKLANRPRLHVIGNAADSGHYFALAAKVATSALLFVGAATTLSTITDGSQIEHSASQVSVNNNSVFTPSIDPVFNFQFNDQSATTLKASHVIGTPEVTVQSVICRNSDVQKCLSRHVGETIEADLIGSHVLNVLVNAFPSDIENEIRDWSSAQNRSFDFGVAAYLANPSDWKAQTVSWEKKISTSIPNAESSELIRSRLVNQIISDAVSRARTLSRAQMEATGIENPVLAQAVLNQRAALADQAFDDGYEQLKAARDPDAISVRNDSANIIAAGVGGVILGVAVNSMLNQQPRYVQPPPVRYVQPQQQYYQTPQYYQAPQYYNGSQSVIGGVQGSMQYNTNPYQYQNNGYGGYIPLTGSRPY